MDPKLKTTKSCKHNLPTPSTPFVGREMETAEIISLLNNQYCRLATLVGPGGIGKTRLALKAAEGLVQVDSVQASLPYPDGVYFVPLQSVSSVEQIAPTIVKALDWEYYKGGNPKEELLTHLQDKSLLLILDNLEHLETAAPLIQEVLDGAPEIKMLVTSREPLNLAEEWLFRVDGLSLPPDESDDGIEISDAVQLFGERARRVRHNFSLAEERTVVLHICRLVEGAPLAIELAAAWVRRLPCAEIAAEIQCSLDILQTDQLGVDDRHRTMRAVFDRSWQMLSQEERDVCKNLSVFQGGSLREAAEQVAGASLLVLSALVDKSQLRLASTGRYAIHKLQCQYATERLDESPARKVEVCDLHSTYYLKFIAHPARCFLSAGNRQLRVTIEAEIDNVLAAWDWAVERKRISDLHMAIEGLYWFSWISTYHWEGERALRHAVKMLETRRARDADRITFAYALALHGSMCIWLGRPHEANEELRASVAMLRALSGARRELAFAVGALGWITLLSSEVATARPLLREAIELDKETEQYELQAFIYCELGAADQRRNAYQDSEQWYLQALELGRAIGDQRTIAHSLDELGWLATNRGEYAKAHHYLDEGLVVARTHGLLSFVVIALRDLGQLATIIGEFDRAACLYQQGLELARQLGRAPQSAVTLMALAQLQTVQEDYEMAGDLYAEAAQYVAETGNREHQIELMGGMGNLALQNGDFANAKLLLDECLTLSRQSEDRLRIAQALIGVGLVAIRQKDSVYARHQLRDALQEGLTIGFAPILANSLTAVAQLFAADGDLRYAAQLAALARDHAATPVATKAQASTLFTQVLQELSPEMRESILDGNVDDDLAAMATRLVAELSCHNRILDKAAVSSIAQPLVEPLSERELQVLRLVAAGNSNRQIGSALTLALGTVKSHLHHIFQKLDVQSRTQAVARARDLNLL